MQSRRVIVIGTICAAMLTPAAAAMATTTTATPASCNDGTQVSVTSQVSPNGGTPEPCKRAETN
jgi:hypothetical protein